MMKDDKEDTPDMKPRAGPLYSPGGDNHLVIYYAQETDLVATMMTHAYMRAILEAKIPGVTEVTNAEASLMVHFDPMRIRYEDLLKEIQVIEEAWTDPEQWASDSNLFEIPVWFNDPWSMECYLTHKELHPLKDGSLSNFEYCAEYVGFSTEELIERLVNVQYFIFNVGFAPGIQGLFPLVERGDILQFPKYEVSRPWSPPRVLCGGGDNFSIHPYVLPGGLQMLGSTPVPMTSLEPAEKVLPALQGKLTLATLGDRFELRSTSKKEYEEIRAEVVAGTYDYKVTAQKWEPKKWIDDPKSYRGTHFA
ncbi:allophanate hydrolase subunit 1 [Chloroflexota bacterium]